MTLSRKLIILFSLLFLAISAGMMAITVNNQRVYLSAQLGSHAQDAATALGITLGPALQKGDTAAVMSFVSAMADGGYYQRIRIVNEQGRALADEHPLLAVEGVPAWFLDMVPLHAPERRALVTRGWEQAGSVLVISHPGYAYKELWRIFINSSAWFTVAWLASVLLITGFIRYILRPLKAMEHQALSICEGRFPPAQQLPDTRELKRVVSVMNKMSGRVQKMIGEKTDMIMRMERELHNDAVTGFGTRKYFESQLRHLLDSGELNAGALFLVRLHDFGGFNDRYGFLEGNVRLKTVARLLLDIFRQTENALFSRFGGAELAVFIPLMQEEDASRFGTAIRAGFATIADEEWPEVGHAGIALSRDGDISTVFSKADMALRVAQAKGPNAWHQFAAEELRPQDVRSKDGWRKLLGGAEIENHIVLAAQPVVSCTGENILHREILARLVSSDNALLPAAVFMPMAKRLGLAPHIDRAVIKKVLSHLDQSKGVYSINLSLASISSPWFREWLRERLLDRKNLASQLIFELPVPASRVSEVLLADFIQEVRPSGCAFLLDQCMGGKWFPDCLGSIPVGMVKLDGSYMEHVAEISTQRLLEAFKDIARARDVAIIATHIETRQQQDSAMQLGFDGLQGKFIGAPVPLEAEPQAGNKSDHP